LEQQPDAATMDAEAQSTIDQLRRRLWIERGLFSAVIAVLAFAWIYPSLFPGVWAVYVQGKPVVAMRDRQSVGSVVDQVKEQFAGNAGAVRFAREVKIARADPAKVEITDQQSAFEKLEAVWKQNADQAIIYIEGTAVVAVPTEEDAKTVLDRVRADLSASVGDLQVAPEFKQAVEVRVESTTEDILADVDTAVALLEGKDAEGAGVHRVVSGDNGWSVARQYDLSLEELWKLNPGVNLNRLHIGQELKVVGVEEPLVTVSAEGRMTAEEPISFRTEIRSSPEMFLGKRLLLQEGKAGKSRVTYRVRSENGKVLEKEELSREEVSPPQSKIVVLGVRPRNRR
jgi:LysM repeat protein